MILDTLANIHLYKALNNNIASAINYITTTNLRQLTPGRHTINDEQVFVIINHYTTKPGNLCEMEAHKKYIDIQVMVEGTEQFGYCPLLNQVPLIPYNSNDDYALYSTDMNYFKLEQGMFAIFFPTDIHQPEIFTDQPLFVKKAIVKVQV